MRNVTKENISDAVMASFAAAPNPRLKLVLDKLVRHMHAFVREVELTHDEWRTGLTFLMAVGDITTEKRNEFSLLSDVLGVSSLVDLVNSAPGATEGSPLGPFHEVGAPFVDNGADLVKDNPGEPVMLTGTVTNTQGHALNGSLIDFWQTAANGLYAQQDPDQRPDNLRCRVLTDEEGRYQLRTIRPTRYSVPVDGPVGALLRATGRHAWRSAHFHMIVHAEDHLSVTTELFDLDDKFIDEDAVFGVRESLIVAFHPDETAPPPATRVKFDIKLRPL